MATAPAQPPIAPQHRSSHVGPILITLFGGILLAFGSCVGFLSSINLGGGSSSGNLSMLYAAGFFAGVVSALSGIVWAIGAFIGFLIRMASKDST